MGEHRVLIVDSDETCKTLSDALWAEGYEVEVAASGQEAQRKFSLFDPHLALLELDLSDMSGLELLRHFKAVKPSVKAVVVSADAHMDTTVEAFQFSADNVFVKPLNLQKTLMGVAKVLKERPGRHSEPTLKSGPPSEMDCEVFVGNSPKMIDVFKMVKVCAENGSKTVLITGESGTGKEMVAQALHRYSPRANRSFLDINCAAIPEALLENELFGHEKGAFTDASNREIGLFEAAHGGTVFLDEIGDMALPMQAKILKLIENKRFRRLGGKTDLNSDVRIIAATNQDLPKLVQEGLFRGDLFYRLNVLHIHLPPLRERKETIPGMAMHFIALLNVEYGKGVEEISSKAMDCLMNYDWPGNCRELRHALEKAVLMEEGRVLSPDFLPEAVKAYLDPASRAREDVTHTFELPPEGIPLEEVERSLIEQALARFEGNQTKAAALLGLSRDTLRYRLKKMQGDEDLEKSCPPVLKMAQA